MIEQRHYDDAGRLMEERGLCARRSAAYCEGLRRGLAWHFAGLPKIPGQDRFTACPYEQATAEYETWQHAFSYAKTLLIHFGMHTPTGPRLEIERPYGDGWIDIIEPQAGTGCYEYQIFDVDAEIEYQSNDAYGSLGLALHAALKRDIEK